MILISMEALKKNSSSWSCPGGCTCQHVGGSGEGFAVSRWPELLGENLSQQTNKSILPLCRPNLGTRKSAPWEIKQANYVLLAHPTPALAFASCQTNEVQNWHTFNPSLAREVETSLLYIASSKSASQST